MFLASADSKNGTIVTLLALSDSTDGGTAVSWDSGHRGSVIAAKRWPWPTFRCSAGSP